MQTIRIRRPGAVSVLVGIVLAGQPLMAQTAPRAREFMQDVIGFTPADIQDVAAGKVVTRLLDTGEKGEVAAFGATWVDADPAVLFERASDIQKFRKIPEILQIGVFSTPPVVSDLAGLTLPDQDIDSLRECKPGSCDVKLGTAFVERLAREVDWKAPDADDKAVALAKETLAEAVKEYQAKGTVALGDYVDKKEPTSLVDEYNVLLADSRNLGDYIPEFFGYLRDYPKRSIEGVNDAFYWTKDNFGLKEVVSIFQATTLRRGEHALFAQKMLYASHYFDAALEVWAIAPAPTGEGFDVLMLYRIRLDPPTGILSTVLMGKVRSGIESWVRENVKNAKARTEAP